MARPRPQRLLRAVALVAFTAVILTLSGGATRSAVSTTSPPILVELFTSQGCSSCPAADRLLSELARSDSSIVALAFHVDYWNYSGWTDPFSSSDWSERQRDYARELQARQIYTPQLIVNGRRHGVGSDHRELSSLLAQAVQDETAGRLAIEITESSSTRLSLRLLTQVEPHATGQDLVAWVALVEDGLETPVGKGENARRTLLNDRVVRRLERVARIDGSGHSHTATFDIEIEPEWQRDSLSVAAFLQDPKSLHVHAAAAVAAHR